MTILSHCVPYKAFQNSKLWKAPPRPIVNDYLYHIK